MPTGYTAAIADGISFNEFVMDCARAMGACITMRDEPSGTPIPEKFEPSNYHQEKKLEASDRLVELVLMSEEAADAKASEDYEEELARWSARIAEIKQLNKRYTQMLIQVLAWKAPTKNHEGLKRFMEDQIRRSIDFDCNISYYIKNPPVKLTGLQWRAKVREHAQRDYEYHHKNYQEEVERVADRNEWIAALRGSLGEVA